MKIQKLCLFLLLGIFIGFSSTEAYAVMEACPPHQTKTKLFAKRDKTIYETRTLEDINHYAGGGMGGIVLAFVEYGGEESLDLEAEFFFSVLDTGAGKYCVKLDNVEAYFYARPRIVMPDIFKKGSCNYNWIYKHEKRHLQALYDYHDRNTKRYSQYLGHIAKSLPIPIPIEEEHVELVKEQIREYFTQRFSKLVDESLMELIAEQRKIDSPSEYQAGTMRFAKCKREDDQKQKKKNDKGLPDIGDEIPGKTFDNPLDGFDPKKDLPF